MIIEAILICIIILLSYLLWRQTAKLKAKEQEAAKSKRSNRENKSKDKQENNPPKKRKKYNVKFKDQQRIVDFAKEAGGNNIVTRHQQNTAVELDNFDRNTPLTKKSFHFRGNDARYCYGCGKAVQDMHPVYILSCKKCGTDYQTKRYFTRDLSGNISLVIGCRTKLGHQVTLKLLRAGSIVIGTTRFPEKTTNLFQGYEDYEDWKEHFDIFPQGLDLDSNNLAEKFKTLSDYILNKYHKLDNLIICAAQTIRVREKDKDEVLAQANEFNRYGDAKFVKETYINSWNMTIRDITQQETEECMRINAVAPALLIQSLLDVMKKSDRTPYIISVHAREGLFQLDKSPIHIHTNMAKAALHQMTRTLVEDRSLVTESGKRFSIHGCDPGWISIDEYYENGGPLIVPPIDEIDGAARILYPLFGKLCSSRFTRRHFNDFSY